MQNHGDANPGEIDYLGLKICHSHRYQEDVLSLEKDRCRVPSAFTLEGTSILRGPITMVSTSEMLQLCRSTQNKGSLGSVAGLAQVRL